MTRSQLLDRIAALEKDTSRLFVPIIGRFVRMTIPPFFAFLVLSVSMTLTRDWWTDLLGGRSAAADSLVVVLPLAVFVLVWQTAEREHQLWGRTVKFTRLWRVIRDLHRDAGLSVELQDEHVERLNEAETEYQALLEL